jgi:hypothetical protein
MVVILFYSTAAGLLIKSSIKFDKIELQTLPYQCYQNWTGTVKTGWSDWFRGRTSAVQGFGLELAVKSQTSWFCTVWLGTTKTQFKKKQ